MNNISIIVENGLCDGCCECISACASNNIYILMSPTAGHPVPFIADDVCTGCGACLAGCRNRVLLTQTCSQGASVLMVN